MEVRDRKCRMRGEGIETISHVIEECVDTGESSRNWRVMMRDGKKNISKLNTIIRKRKERELIGKAEKTEEFRDCDSEK